MDRVLDLHRKIGQASEKKGKCIFMRVTTCLDLQGLRRGKEEVREREDEGNKRN